MLATLQTLVLFLVVIAFIAFVAGRLKVPPSILLVVAGTIIALIPGLPRLELAPELVLLIVLPPVIYSGAVAMSWREFRFNLRPIGLLAIGGVLVTTLATGAAAHVVLGFPWPVGFTLGAIVSPPDAVAPLSIMRRMKLPRRLGLVLEGEGVANDATALILYRFAVAAVSAGTFSFGRALGAFLLICAGEITWGVVAGIGMLQLRRRVGDVRIEILLSILTPFVAYWPPQALGGSGVVATVAAGLTISWNGLRLISAATRLQGIFFWDFLNYLIEGMVFLVTGLQAHRLLSGIHGYSTREITLSVLVVWGTLVATRFAWVFPATYIPRWLVPRIARRDPSPPWQGPFLVAFTGVRGIVSLAAALALPQKLNDGSPFPHRDMILFLTFSIILLTLVGQGLALPLLVRWLRLSPVGEEERQVERDEEHRARLTGVEAAVKRLDQLIVERGLSEEVVRPLRAHQDEQLEHLAGRGRTEEKNDPGVRALRDEIAGVMLTAERDAINDLFRDGHLKDEARRRLEKDLDLREAQLRHQQEPSE
jgi:CPA1 family monovalent cation:H+ antiporter